MSTSKKMLLVTDGTGRILAAAPKYEGKPRDMSTGLAPLAGQEIREVEVPEELTRLKSGHDFHLALSHARFDRATGTLAFPKLTVKKIRH